MRFRGAWVGLWLLACLPLRAQEVPLYLMDVPPYAMDAPEGKGMVGDVVLEAMRRAGYTPKVLVVPSPRALQQVPKMEDVLIIPLARLREREAQFTWIAHILDVERAFYTRERKVASFAEARAAFQTVAVSRGSAGYFILLEQGFDKEQILEVNQGLTAPKMLQLGRVDAWYNPVLEADRLQGELEGSPRFVASTLLGPTGQYLGCAKACNPAMVHRLSSAIREMQKDGTVQKIIARYLPR